MKNYTQVYVKNSFEAAETYCKAFGAEITREFKNEDNTAYEHCELSVNGEGFLALAEAKNPCDISIVHKYKWETMTFNAFEMGTEEAVHNAFQVLSAGGVVLEPIGELPWSKCCATIIDKYGVCWWISIYQILICKAIPKQQGHPCCFIQLSPFSSDSTYCHFKSAIIGQKNVRYVLQKYLVNGTISLKLTA